jgi:hypothetical protein
MRQISVFLLLAAQAANADCALELGVPVTAATEMRRMAPLVAPETLMVLGAMESGFDEDARSPADALGILQVTPTAAWEVWLVARKRRADAVWLKHCSHLPEPSDESILKHNIRFGACYWRLVSEQMQGNVALTLAAYNGGYRQTERLAAGKRVATETAQYISKYLYLVERSPSCRK